MKRRKRARDWPPKGSYPHPAGGYIHQGPVRPGQQIRITTHLKQEPDYDALAKAFILLAEIEQRQREVKS